MISPFFYPHIGGVETHVLRVGEELVRQGHEVIVLTAMHDERLPEAEHHKGIRILRFPGHRPVEGRRWLLANRSLLRNVDLVHCHDFDTFFDLYLPFRVGHPGKPTFVTFHGHEGVLPIPASIVLKRRITEKLTDGNICIGDFIPKWYGTKADIVSYGGADEIEDPGSSEQGAVFIGRLEEDTGILTYIEALRVLKAEWDVDLTLDVFGDGGLRGTIEDRSERYGLRVTVHGMVNEPWLRARGEFAFVSGYLSILEAMARKKLVFAVYENELKRDYLTMIPGAEGMMEISSSPESLAKVIGKRMDDRGGRREMVNRAYDFSKRSTWKKVAEQYLRLWGVSHG